MKGKTAFNAMEGIDPRYILEAAPDAAVRKGSKAPYIRILAVAATVAVLTAVAVLGAGILKQSGENPPVIPPIGETENTHEPTEGEHVTDAPIEDETVPTPNGSYTTALYAVEEIDGKHYINFVDGNEKPDPDSSGSAGMIKGIYFSSIEEMKQKFLQGNFTASEVTAMKAQLTLTEKGFEIPDMMNLYDAVLPEGWSVRWVCLDGQNLYLSVQNDQTFDESTEDYLGESGYIAIHAGKSYDTMYQNYFLSYIEKNEKYLVQEKTNFHGFPCRIFENRTEDTLRRDVVMEVPVEEGTFDVLVKYRIKLADTDGTSTPYSMSMYGELFGRKVEVYLSGFETDPQEDFYSSFGIQPHQTN